MQDAILLKKFVKIRPEFEILQDDYPKMNHMIQYQSYLKNNGNVENLEFKEENFKNISNYMCKSDRLLKRAFFIDDLLHENPDLRTVSNTNENANGATLFQRMNVFEKISLKLFNEFYHEEIYKPDILCFTSSVGYLAPSPAQRFLSAKGWNQTNVFHVFHTGCYGAFPAINIAASQLLTRKHARGVLQTADVVHIESNFLHYNPSKTEASQLINHSLFGDGAIKYKIEIENKDNCENALKLIYTFDKMIPNSIDAVNFRISDCSFYNVMSKDLANIVIDNVTDYLIEMCSHAKLDFEEVKRDAVFALHPGGPKILDGIVEKLNLKSWQVENSYWVFENYGNMSSATLPHVLERILNDDKLKGKYVIALGMSPGITMGSAVFKCV